MFDKTLAERAARNLAKVRERRPLVHNITNFVVMNCTANALLACGASPVMAHAPEEVEEMVSMAGALVLNIGTLSREWIESMIKAGKRANERGIPVILDPVGAGATRFRSDSAKRIMDELKITLLRGNASEVLSLAGEGSETKGVDSIHSVDEAADAAVAMSDEVEVTLAITGEIDLVTDGVRIAYVFNGDPLMSRVTGTGCMATSIMGAFLAVEDDAFAAAATALAYFGLCGEKAALAAKAPGTFQAALVDALYTMDEKGLKEGARIRT